MSKLTPSTFPSEAANSNKSFESDVDSAPPTSDQQQNYAQQQQQQQQQQQPRRAQQPLPSLEKYSNKAAVAISRLAPAFSHTPRSTGSTSYYIGNNKASIGGQQIKSDAFAAISQTDKSPDASHSGSYQTEKPVAAIDTSPDRSRVVLAGRDLLRIAGVDSEGGLTDDVDILRRVNAKHREQLSIVDVKWSRYQGDLVATAVGSGRIVLYNLNRPLIDFLTLYEHVRQVHKLAFNPYGDHLFLSASHDGSIKIWDLRDVRDSRRSKSTFQGANQGVRDVKWSTTDAFEFAAATDSGVVQRWDMRKHRAPTLQLNAHDHTCHSLDYHPTSKYLATAGMDKKVKVWDTTRTERRQNACWQLQAPQAVFNISWRPGGGSPRFDEGLEIKQDQMTQIASSYDTKDPRIHIWDFSRPSIPCRELDTSDQPTTSVLWRSENLLWSAGGSSNVGHFSQTDIQKSTRPIDRLNTNVIAMGPGGNMAFFSDTRSLKVGESPEIPVHTLHRVNTGSSTSDRLSSSLSAHEASYGEGGALSSRLKNRRKQAAASRLQAGTSRSGDALLLGEFNDLPTSTGGLSLDEKFRSSQTGAYGQLHGIFNYEVFQELAKRYTSLPHGLNAFDYTAIGLRLESLFMANANEASTISDDGLAHTWRVLAWAVKKELEEWSSAPVKAFQRIDALHKDEMNGEGAFQSMQRLQSQTQSTHVHKKNQKSIERNTNPSNLPTPKVRPARGSNDVPALPHETMDPPQGTNSRSKNNLKKSIVTHDFAPASRTHHASKDDGLSESDRDQHDGAIAPSNEQELVAQSLHNSPNPLPVFDDLEESLTARKAAASTFRMTPRPVLRLGNNVGDGLLQGGSLLSGGKNNQAYRSDIHRRDSGESFDILSESVESRNKSLGVGSFQESLRSSGASFGESRREFEGSPSSAGFNSTNRQIKIAEVAMEPFDDASGPQHQGTMFSEGNTDSLPDMRFTSSHRSYHKSDPLVHKADVDTDTEANANDISAAVDGRGLLSANENTYEEETMNVLLPVQLSLLDPEPWHASSFLPALLQHHLDRLASIQLPVHLAIYLNQFYPLMFPTVKTRDHLKTLGQGVLISKQPTSYNRLLVIVLTYHAQLVSLKQFTAAASLRRACQSIYPEICYKVSPGTLKSYWCRVCRKLSKGRDKGYCTRCQSRWGGCSICSRIRIRRQELSQHAPSDLSTQTPGQTADSPSASLEASTMVIKRRKVTSRRWFYCQACGHGGHTSCMIDWLRRPESSGSCPVPGCQHACGPGVRREDARIELAHRKAEYLQLRRGNGVLRDDKVAQESRAVMAARPNAADMDTPEAALKEGDVRAGGDFAVSSSTVGGIPMESVGGPSMAAGMGGGMGMGRNRWRSSRRTARSSAGTGAGADAGFGETGVAAATAAAADLVNNEAAGGEANYLMPQRLHERSATTTTTASNHSENNGQNEDSGSLLGRLSFESNETSLSEP